MAKTKRKSKRREQPALIDNAIVDRFLEGAAQTVRQVEEDLQSSFRIPASALTLRIQTNR
jgi:hypothetical protein